MADDPNLVEAIARRLRRMRGCEAGEVPCPFCHWDVAEEETGCIAIAETAIAAINSSGTHWVAPWSATESMICAADDVEDDMERTGHGQGCVTVWQAMRTAYLAKTETKP